MRLAAFITASALALGTVGCGVQRDATPRPVQCYTDTYCQLYAGEDFCSSWIDPTLYFCSHTCNSDADCAAPFSCRRLLAHGMPVQICYPADWDGTEM